MWFFAQNMVSGQQVKFIVLQHSSHSHPIWGIWKMKYVTVETIKRQTFCKCIIFIVSGPRQGHNGLGGVGWCSLSSGLQPCSGGKGKLEAAWGPVAHTTHHGPQRQGKPLPVTSADSNLVMAWFAIHNMAHAENTFMYMCHNMAHAEKTMSTRIASHWGPLKRYMSGPALFPTCSVCSIITL